MNLILLGAPGAGKGTQAEKISEKFNIPSISTGEILRTAIREGTALGMNAKSFIDSGALVPDEVVIGIVREYLAGDKCKNGFILDGFPRSIPQAEALDKMGVVIDAVVDIEVPDEVITKRMSGRRVCPSCGAGYHIEHNPTKIADKCDRCGTSVIIRKDDAPETVAGRLVTYHNQTEPLIDYYKKKGILIVIEGQSSIDGTTALVYKALEGLA